MLKQVKEALDREGIDLPYPHSVEISKGEIKLCTPLAGLFLISFVIHWCQSAKVAAQNAVAHDEKPLITIPVRALVITAMIGSTIMVTIFG
jgi:hypothetical protein